MDDGEAWKIITQLAITRSRVLKKVYIIIIYIIKTDA
jgi:hypothetical protein